MRVVFLLAVLVSARAANLPPGNYVAVPIVTGGAPSGAINSIGQVLAEGGLWEPVVANSNVGSLAIINGVGNAGCGGQSGACAVGINNRGQILEYVEVWNGTQPQIQGYLWSPDSPNATTGSLVSIPVAYPAAINNFGQVIGIAIAGGIYAGGILWTPSSPNGATGTTIPFSSTAGNIAITGIDDFGQVTVNPGVGGPYFCTPSTPNGPIGGCTSIPGMTSVMGISNHGTVFGTAADSSGNTHGFLWTPTSPQGTTGTTSEIPIPAGFNQLFPVAINASDQVLGYLLQSCCVRVPFLYAGGTVYDLTAVDSRLSGAYPTAINAAGQIVLNGADGETYMVSPTPLPVPPGPQTVPITITSQPPGRGFIVSGSGCSPGAYLAPQTLNWIPQSNCTVAFVNPQGDAIGRQYVFSGWQDGPATYPRAIVAPSQPAAYTANYTTQYLLTTSSNPPGGGTVSGAGWYNANSTAVLTATPAGGFRLADWASSPAVSVLGPSSASITVTGPFTITADFAMVTGPALTDYTVTRLGSGPSAVSPRLLNSFGQVVFGTSLWTPITPNGATGSAVDVGFNVAALNNRGQVAGTLSLFTNSDFTPQAMLWSPATPNGSSGSAIPVPATSPLASAAVGINNFGQVIGESGGSCANELAPYAYCNSFLWTPSSPNGTLGTINADATGDHFTAINDLGQAIGGGQLYTPSVANGGSGTLTNIPGITGSNGTALVDINDTGVIAGASIFPPCVQCYRQGFLWTPNTPHAASGAVSPLPVSAGYLGMNPVALNNSGQIVGTMTDSNGIVRPFLYKGGTVYDLGTVSSEFSTATPAGINDSGQIVLQAFRSAVTGDVVVYLLSPAQLPSADSVVPGAGSAQNQGLVFTFSDPLGWQDLDVVNVLVNNFLDGRQSCYLAYSRSLNTLYLVNDTGTALLPGLALNGSGSVANSQCTVFGGGSIAAGSGNSLVLTLNMSFNPSFAGNKVVYLAARNLAADNSGWQALGTWNVPGAAVTPTAAANLTPERGTGVGQTFTFTFNDARGWQDLGVVDMLINNSLDGRQACYLAYSRPLNTVYLVNDAGTALLPGIVPNPASSVANSQCTVTGFASTVNGLPETSVSGSGNTLTLTFSISFSSSFSGNKITCMAARDVTDTVNSGWQAMGSWTVQ